MLLWSNLGRRATSLLTMAQWFEPSNCWPCVRHWRSKKEYIHPRQSWENLVETHFNVMRRMSQVHFEQVTSWEGAKLAHERFVTDYNAQPHWAPPQTRGQPPKPCRSVGLGHQQTPHAGTITSDFLCDALSPPLGSAGLCAFSSLETLWRRNTGSPSRSHLAAR